MALQVTWLFSSKGSPIAFLYHNAVFSPAGKFLGCLEGKYVVNGEYVGELFGRDRFVRQRFRPLIDNHYEHENFQLEMSPPKPVEAIVLPSDLQDIGPF